MDVQSSEAGSTTSGRGWRSYQIGRGQGRGDASHLIEAPLYQHLPLYGRQRDIEIISGLLSRHGTQLITLTGMGGVGKTVLALAALHTNSDTFSTLCVVDASAGNPEIVERSIAEGFGVLGSSDAELYAGINKRSSDRPAIVLIDACDDTSALRDVVSRLMMHCPGLLVVATSRRRLHLRAEQLYPVMPLPVPDINEDVTVDEFATNASVALFVDRLRLMRPDFEITERNVTTIVDLCCRLDGLPLAIELAAERGLLLSPAGLLARLDDPLTLLVADTLDRPPRHRSLRVLLDDEFQRIAPEDQRLAQELARLPDDTKMSAISHLGSEVRDELRHALAARLGVLAEHHIVQLIDDGSGDWNIRIPSIVRAYLLSLHLEPEHAAKQESEPAAGEIGQTKLSRRELDVVRGICRGLTNRQISVELGIAERTVDSHVGNILRRLEVASRLQIASWAHRHNIVER